MHDLEPIESKSIRELTRPIVGDGPTNSLANGGTSLGAQRMMILLLLLLLLF